MSQTDLLALLERVAPLIDERCGVLTNPVPLTFAPGFGEHMYGYAACVARPTQLHPRPCAMSPELGGLVGYGTALDDPLARVRAVCEGLERYCSVMYPTQGVRRARPGELDGEVCDHARFPQCSETERARGHAHVRAPDPSREDDWIQAFSLLEGVPVWLPLSAVHLGLPIPMSEHVTWPMSTGFAAGSSFEDAVLSGLLEVIERDSLALWWLQQLPMPEIIPDPSNIDPRLSALLEQGRELGVDSHLYDLSTDLGVPVVGVIQVDPHASPHVVTMGACRPRGVDAAVRVLEEAGSLRIAMLDQAPISPDAFTAGQARTPEEFGALYAGRDAIERFAFALEAPTRRTDFPAPIAGDPLETIVARLGELGKQVLVVDVTLPEVRAVGVVVVKVIVPELMPISFSHDVRYLAHPRLYDVPLRLGYGRRDESMVTPDPIPFA